MSNVKYNEHPIRFFEYRQPSSFNWISFSKKTGMGWFIHFFAYLNCRMRECTTPIVSQASGYRPQPEAFYCYPGRVKTKNLNGIH